MRISCFRVAQRGDLKQEKLAWLREAQGWWQNLPEKGGGGGHGFSDGKGGGLSALLMYNEYA